MPEAYFVKINKDTSWEKLIEVTQIQRHRHCRPLPYYSLIEISLEVDEFNELANTIAKPNTCYLSYTSQSIADAAGIWGCITIKCKKDDRNLVLYTAGRTFPMYAAIDTEITK